MYRFPNLVVHNIMQFANIPTIGRMAQVNKRFNKVYNEFKTKIMPRKVYMIPETIDLDVLNNVQDYHLPQQLRAKIIIRAIKQDHEELFNKICDVYCYHYMHTYDWTGKYAKICIKKYIVEICVIDGKTYFCSGYNRSSRFDCDLETARYFIRNGAPCDNLSVIYNLDNIPSVLLTKIANYLDWQSAGRLFLISKNYVQKRDRLLPYLHCTFTGNFNKIYKAPIIIFKKIYDSKIRLKVNFNLIDDPKMIIHVSRNDPEGTMKWCVNRSDTKTAIKIIKMNARCIQFISNYFANNYSRKLAEALKHHNITIRDNRIVYEGNWWKCHYLIIEKLFIMGVPATDIKWLFCENGRYDLCRKLDDFCTNCGNNNH